MEWTIEFQNKSEEHWTEFSRIPFGHENESELRVDIYFHKDETLPFKILCGFDLCTFDYKRFPERFQYEFNQELARQFSDFNPQTSGAWWCAQFALLTLHEALELCCELREYILNFYSHRLPIKVA